MRKSGILLPISALKSKYGIGSFSKDAYEFVDWIAEAGQTYWQILPLGPTSFGDSPYQTFSSFAGNPYYISLESLIDEGLISEEICNKADFGKNERAVDYSKLYKNRFSILYEAYQNWQGEIEEEYTAFELANAYWLEDYASFMAIKENENGKSWLDWETNLKNREETAIREKKNELKDKINFWKFIQYKFSSQWNELKKYANEKGILIIGDIPIYTALDSSDVWSNSKLFQLDKNKIPTHVAGCPPDGFSKDGQLWGNPLYNWEAHKETNYEWWYKRLLHSFDMYDVVRIDHFRGFDEYYSIKYTSKNAKNGTWEKGPGKGFFSSFEKIYGKKNIIAEDLGFMTDSVKELLEQCKFPGMKVLQFAFDERDTGAQNDYLPHNYSENCVAYTGTHDNSTIISWFFEIKEEEREAVRTYLCDNFTPDSAINWPMIGAIMRSKADICIIPIQDYLGYDSRSRINKPSTSNGNWLWRSSECDFDFELQNKIKRLTIATGRINKKALI